MVLEHHRMQSFPANASLPPTPAPHRNGKIVMVHLVPEHHLALKKLNREEIMVERAYGESELNEYQGYKVFVNPNGRFRYSFPDGTMNETGYKDIEDLRAAVDRDVAVASSEAVANFTPIPVIREEDMAEGLMVGVHRSQLYTQVNNSEGKRISPFHERNARADTYYYNHEWVKTALRRMKVLQNEADILRRQIRVARAVHKSTQGTISLAEYGPALKNCTKDYERSASQPEVSDEPIAPIKY